MRCPDNVCDMMPANATNRFSSRVDDYIKYRPGYPDAIVALFNEACGLTARSIIADIGSGTGIFAEQFLKHGTTVFGVEPNQDMRLAAERLQLPYSKFHSVAGTAEATTLPDNCADFITVAQAFHWFDRESARREFQRILKPGGWVALVWNERIVESSLFLQDYERLLQTYGTDYRQVDHRQVDERVIADFFKPHAVDMARFPNRQEFDFDGLKGRLLSSSYTPEPGNKNYEPMLRELDGIYRKHAVNGRVIFEYDTKVFYSRWTA